MKADHAGQTLLYGPPKAKAARKPKAIDHGLPPPPITVCLPPPRLAEPPAKPRSATATQVLAHIINGESVTDEIVVFRGGGTLSSSQVRHARAELIARGEAEYTGTTGRTVSGKPAKEWRRKGGLP
jgi:hypothetical protein